MRVAAAATGLLLLGAAGLLLLGACGAALRWTLMALEPGLAGLILLQALHAATFGIAHLGIVQFVRDQTPGHVAATALSINSALTFGLGLAAATAVSGVLYDRVGSSGYWAMAALAVAGAVAAAALRMRSR